jgi:hypothetical protein
MVKFGVLFEVRTELLNKMQMSLIFKGTTGSKVQYHPHTLAVDRRQCKNISILYVISVSQGGEYEDENLLGYSVT